MGSRGRLARAAVGAAVASVCALTPVATSPLTATAVPAAAAPGDPRPNVVLVVVDDLGWGDLGSGRFNGGHPNRFVDTPAMDRLAAQGMAFPNAYGALACAPSRMALLTGQFAQGPDNGVYGGVDANTVAKSYDGKKPTLRGVDNQNPTERSHLAASSTTVPELIAAEGYWNAHVGKFDVTSSPAKITGAHGFDVNYGGGKAGNPGQYPAKRTARGFEFSAKVDPTMDRFADPYTREYVEQNVLPYSTGVPRRDVLDLVGERKNLTDAVGDAALDAVRTGAQTGDPFFVAVNEFGVHSPVGTAQARPDLLAKYERRSRPRDGRVPSYAALVEGVDQTVGRILDDLSERPDPRSPGETLAENTIVMLTSDNGGRLSRNQRYTTGFGGDNGPLRGQKFQLWEGGIRVPTAAWSGDPGLVRPRVVNRSLVHVSDLAATLADVADVPAAYRRGLDGVSLREAFARGSRARTSLLIHYPGYGLGRGRDQRPATVMRTDDWKVYYDYESRRLRLFDLRRDPSESRDRARSRPALARRLGIAMAAELERLDTPLPTLRQKIAPLRIPVRRGTVTYVDGEVTRHTGPQTLRLRVGDEMPVVVSPPRGRDRR